MVVILKRVCRVTFGQDSTQRQILQASDHEPRCLTWDSKCDQQFIWHGDSDSEVADYLKVARGRFGVHKLSSFREKLIQKHRNPTSFYRKIYATVVSSKTGSMLRLESVAVDSSLKEDINAFGAVSEERQLEAAPSGSGGQPTLVIHPGHQHPSGISSTETSTDEYNVPSAPASEALDKDQLKSIDPVLADSEKWLTSQSLTTRRSFASNDRSVSDTESGSSPSGIYELRDLRVTARVQESLLKMHVDAVDEEVVHSGARMSELTISNDGDHDTKPVSCPSI